MNSERLAEVIHKQFAVCEDLLTQKAKEYAPVDRLHNFRVAAQLQNVNLETALGGMMAKHTVSLYDLIERTEQGEVFSSDIWMEKITDHMNYLFLLTAILEERWEKGLPKLEFNSREELRVMAGLDSTAQTLAAASSD